MTGKASQSKPLHARLENLSLLDGHDHAHLDKLLSSVQSYAAGTLIQPEEGPIEYTRVLLDGWAVRSRSLQDGSRQVVKFLMSGDTIGLYGTLFPTSASAVELISDARVAEVPCDRLLDVFAQSVRLGVALCWIAGHEERLLEQQIVRLGRLDARKRIGHLLLELFYRAVFSGLKPLRAARIPVSQTLIAQALGLSKVHVNRSLRALREADLVQIQSGCVHLLQPDVLKRECHFSYQQIFAHEIPEAFRARLNAAFQVRLKPAVA